MVVKTKKAIANTLPSFAQRSHDLKQVFSYHCQSMGQSLILVQYDTTLYTVAMKQRLSLFNQHKTRFTTTYMFQHHQSITAASKAGLPSQQHDHLESGHQVVVAETSPSSSQSNLMMNVYDAVIRQNDDERGTVSCLGPFVGASGRLGDI